MTSFPHDDLSSHDAQIDADAHNDDNKEDSGMDEDGLVASGAHPLGDAVAAILDGMNALRKLDARHQDLCAHVVHAYQTWIADHLDAIPVAYTWPLLCKVYGLDGLRAAISRTDPVPAALLDKAALSFRAPHGTWTLDACTFDLTLEEADGLLRRGFPLQDVLFRGHPKYLLLRAIEHALTVEGSWLLARWQGRLSPAALWFREQGRFVLPDTSLSQEGAQAVARAIEDLVTKNKPSKADMNLLADPLIDARCWGALIQIAYRHGSLDLYRHSKRKLLTRTHRYSGTLAQHDAWLFERQSAHAAVERAARLQAARDPVAMLRLPYNTPHLEDADVLFAPRHPAPTTGQTAA